MEQMPPRASSPTRRRLLRLLPLVVIVGAGLWLLGRQANSVELELAIGERAQGLHSMEVALVLLPDEVLVRRSELFFSERAPAPSVVTVRSHLQKGRRYRMDLKLMSREAATRQPLPSADLSREFTYDGQTNLRLTF
ncbi:MAG: hypothetical protein LBM75_10440 [Myxococcales bacterium]|nr:hypothetical protein [Myxococcales bacterium]